MPERFATLGTVYKRFSPMKQMNQRSFIFQSGLIVAVVFILTMPVRGTEPLAQWFGDDFDGGAKKLFGASLHGRERANCVYAKSNSTTSPSTMGGAVLQTRFGKRGVSRFPKAFCNREPMSYR